MHMVDSNAALQTDGWCLRHVQVSAPFLSHPGSQQAWLINNWSCLRDAADSCKLHAVTHCDHTGHSCQALVNVW